MKARADTVSANARAGVEKRLRRHGPLHGHPGARPVRGGRRRPCRRGAADRAADLHQCRRPRARSRHARRARRAVPHEHVDAGARSRAAASGRRRRQLRRPRVRADVPALRRRGDRRREGAAADRAGKTRMCRRRSGRILEAEGIQRPHRRRVHQPGAARAKAWRSPSTARAARREAIGSHVLLAVGRRPNTDDLGLDRAGVDGRRARLHHRGRHAGDQRARHLGARRLQRPRRIHPHRLQRFRDRRREPARRRAPQAERAHSGVCALYRSAARPRRDDRDAGARHRPAAADEQTPDDPGRAARSRRARRRAS